MKKKNILLVIPVLLLGVSIYWWGHSDGSAGKSSLGPNSANAQDAPAKTEPEVSPTKVSSRHRDAYYPNTEDLGPYNKRSAFSGVLVNFKYCMKQVALDQLNHWFTRANFHGVR